MVIANVLPKSQTVDILVRQLSKKRRFRTRFDIQHVKASQILAKSPWEQFYLVFFIILKEIDLENVSSIVRWNLKGFCLHIDWRWPISCSGFYRICNSQLKCNYLKKEKLFLDFFFLHFWNLHHILNILKEKLIVIVNVFPKLQNVRIFVRKLSKEHRLRRGFGSQHVKESQMVGKSPWESFDEVFLSFSVRLIWKMPPLVFGEVLGMFVNKLTPDGKYPVEGCEDLQLQLKCNYLKNKTFFPNFCSISGVYIKFWIFWKQYDCHS